MTNFFFRFRYPGKFQSLGNIKVEILILSEVSQTEKDKYHMTSHMWNLKYDTNEFIEETETGSQT